MKYVLDIFIGFVFATIFVTCFMSKEILVNGMWIGIAIGIDISFTILKWNSDRIDKLEKEIKELKLKNTLKTN